jgi:uncharacterized protein YhdP
VAALFAGRRVRRDGQHREGRQQVLLQSSLQGVTSALPAPFSKEPVRALPLQVELAPDERLKVKLGACSRPKLVRAAGRALVVQRAAFRQPSGDAPLRLPERSGTLDLRLAAGARLDKWLPLSAPDAPWTRARSTCRSASSTSTASG